MSDQILKHEVTHLTVGKPYNIIVIRSSRVDEPSYLPHWHEELELVYSWDGTAVSYVDGVEYQTARGDLLVMNSNSIHSIRPLKTQAEEGQTLAVVMQIHKEFLKLIFPEMDSLHFSNDNMQADGRIAHVMQAIMEEMNSEGPDIVGTYAAAEQWLNVSSMRMSEPLSGNNPEPSPFVSAPGPAGALPAGRIVQTDGKQSSRTSHDIADTEEASTPDQTADPYRDLYLQSLLVELVACLCRTRLENPGTRTPVNVQKNIERLRGVLQYIENHYTEPILQSEVASKFYFNVDYFSRFFRKNMGMSFIDYLTDYRITKAMDRLVGSSDTVLDIALQNGFPDGRAYTNAFRKRYHQTPLHYRKAYAKN